MEERTLHPLDYLSVLRRRKWWFIVPLAVCIAGGALLTMTLSRQYLSSATIGITAPRVSQELVRGASTLDRDERLRALSQHLLSRPLLEQVARAENLAGEDGLDGAVHRLRAGVRVDVPPSVVRTNRTGFDSFLIGYLDESPERAQRVANRLAELFIEETSKSREARAEGTSEFLATQLAASQQRLDRLEERLRIAKEAHMGRLPEQTGTNLQLVNGLRQQLESTSTSLRGEQDRLSMIERQIEAIRQGAGDTVMPMTPDARVVQVQRELREAQMRYTARHPEIGRLERELAAARAEVTSAREEPPESRLETLRADPAYRALIADRDRANLRIRDLQRSEQTLRSQIAQYQNRVESAPMIEQQMTSLNREYELEKQQYGQLAARHQAALVAEDLERKRGAEHFSIIYPAYLPRVPESPNATRLMLMALALGLVLGGGLVVGREFIDRSVYDVRALEDEFDVPVLGEIPRIERVA
jgi:polysaccharide biosynthesis transport protein